MEWVVLIIGLAAMILGSDQLVRGCVRFARRVQLSEFITSILIIGIGTSLPELVISILSSFRGIGGLALSNTIGSNIINVLGIMGLGFVLHAVPTDARARRLDIAFVMIAGVALVVMMMTGILGRLDAAILFSMFLIYSVLATRRPARKPEAHKIHALKIAIPIAIGGLALYLGSKYFMDALTVITRSLHMGDRLAGILITAPGTSVPELLVTIVAAIHRRPGIALGNILGSNLANILLVVAAAAVIRPITVSPELMRLDIWVMIASTTMLCAQLCVAKKLGRKTGILYLLLLAVYFYWLI
ncbi:MAG: sodium:calcium antiporter [Rickettsiales bacterium]|jgi:cation:H+ antiporter|nr:sodium:calcium antiporter [Rickettsiales bacterium]